MGVREARAGHRSQARHIPMLLFLSDNNCPVELVRGCGAVPGLPGTGSGVSWCRLSLAVNDPAAAPCSQLGPSSLSVDSGRLGPGQGGQTTGIQCCGPATRQGTRGLQSSQTSSGAGARAQISSTESADHALSPHSPVSEYPRSVPTFPGRAEPGRARTTVTQLGIGSAAREHTDPDQGLRVRLMTRMGLGFRLH